MSIFLFGGATRIRTGDEGFADPCLTTWPWRRISYFNIIARGRGFVNPFLKKSSKRKIKRWGSSEKREGVIKESMWADGDDEMRKGTWRL